MKLALTLCAIFLLDACNRNEIAPPPKLFKEQREALDKAKAIDMTQQQGEEQRREVDRQSQ